MNTSPKLGERPVPQSLHVLMAGLIDYAGLFLPAALDMNTAVRNYGSYLDGADGWMLARFVVPANRLPEFQRAQASVPVVREWKLSALLGSDAAGEIEAVAEFNLRNAGRARVNALESKAASYADIAQFDSLLPADTEVYFEIPLAQSTELIVAIAKIGGRAKIRTGGLSPESIPSSGAVAKFIADCAVSNLAFKATAGLHHPLRCVRPLTQNSAGPSGTMHGFLNVFLAAALWCGRGWSMAGGGTEFLIELLEAKKPVLEFADDGVRMSVSRQEETCVATAQIRNARQNFAISFGSCSFEEPISDLRDLNLL